MPATRSKPSEEPRPPRAAADGPHGGSMVPRRRLVERLIEGNQTRLVLIDAPAGFGKSTVLAEWERADPRPFAWLTLSERHNDPVLLTESIAGAVAEVTPVGEDVYRALNGSKEGTLKVAVPRLLESVHRSDSPMVLALDDLHELNDTDSLSSSARSARASRGGQLALASRNEPTMRLGRFRANRDLTELDPGDLAMTKRETAAMLRACGLRLDPKSIDVLRERTEGGRRRCISQPFRWTKPLIPTPMPAVSPAMTGSSSTTCATSSSPTSIRTSRLSDPHVDPRRAFRGPLRRGPRRRGSASTLRDLARSTHS